MQLRLDAFEAHLASAAQRGLAPLYVLFGDEPLLQIEAADALRRTARGLGFSEREVMVSDRHFSWASVLNASQSMSLFGDRKLLELRIPTGKPGREGADVLKAYAAQQAGVKQASDTVTLITLPRLDGATQKSAWFSALAAAGVTVRIDTVERTALPAWIAQRLARQQQRVEAGADGKRALQFIADRVEGNLLAAHQEIQKLGLLHPPGELKLAEVQDAVLNVARYDVYKLSEAMLAGDVPRLVRTLDGLRGEGEATVLVLWTITEDVRTLARVRAGLEAGRPITQLLRECRVWGARERLMPDAVRRLPRPALERALALCAQLDRQNKGLRATGLPGDVWDGLLQLCLSVARGEQAQ